MLNTVHKFYFWYKFKRLVFFKTLSTLFGLGFVCVPVAILVSLEVSSLKLFHNLTALSCSLTSPISSIIEIFFFFIIINFLLLFHLVFIGLILYEVANGIIYVGILRHPIVRCLKYFRVDDIGRCLLHMRPLSLSNFILDHVYNERWTSHADNDDEDDEVANPRLQTCPKVLGSLGRRLDSLLLDFLVVLHAGYHGVFSDHEGVLKGTHCLQAPRCLLNFLVQFELGNASSLPFCEAFFQLFLDHRLNRPPRQSLS